jgi:hypothetical protein
MVVGRRRVASSRKGSQFLQYVRHVRDECPKTPAFTDEYR